LNFPASWCTLTVVSSALLAACLLSVALAFALWLVGLNRVLNRWPHSPAKPYMMGLSLVGALAAGALWPAVVGSPMSYALPALGMVLLGVGEIRRLSVRARAQGRDLRATAAQSERLVSTTALLVRRATVAVPGLPALRVVHLSDLHVGADLPFEYYRSTIARSLEEKPDLILITGDFVSHAEHLPLLRQLLVGGLRARYGVYAVLGNHDYWSDPQAVSQVLAEAGIRCVTGEWVTVDLGGDRRIAIGGTDEPWGPALGRHVPDVQATIALSHTPDNVYRLAELGASAVFSGHTHGGQFRLPRWGGLVIPSRYGRRFDRGHFRVGDTHLFISAGVGIDSIPLRLFCPPDFLVVDFVEPSRAPG
jgi:predicted MPP superfamily phosphohydrolase